jgi:hypothetical protein
MAGLIRSGLPKSTWRGISEALAGGLVSCGLMSVTHPTVPARRLFCGLMRQDDCPFLRALPRIAGSAER